MILLLSFLLVSGTLAASIGNGDARIFGGGAVEPFKYPWLVSISQFGAHGCGGALIAPNIVLTAAHCNMSMFKRAAGDDSMSLDKIFGITAHRHDLAKPIKSEKAISLKLIKMYSHPEYKLMDRVPPWNDISLWHVTGGEKALSGYEFPKMSFNDSQFLNGKLKAQTAGWGMTSYDTENDEGWSEPLKEITVPFVKQTQCKKALELPPNLKLTSICAGGLAGESSCSGDSGSPLWLQQPDGKYDIIGITSAGGDEGACGQKGMPVLYTRISLYKDWIMKTIKEINQQS